MPMTDDQKKLSDRLVGTGGGHALGSALRMAVQEGDSNSSLHRLLDKSDLSEITKNNLLCLVEFESSFSKEGLVTTCMKNYINDAICVGLIADYDSGNKDTVVPLYNKFKNLIFTLIQSLKTEKVEVKADTAEQHKGHIKGKSTVFFDPQPVSPRTRNRALTALFGHSEKKVDAQDPHKKTFEILERISTLGNNMFIQHNAIEDKEEKHAELVAARKEANLNIVKIKQQIFNFLLDEIIKNNQNKLAADKVFSQCKRVVKLLDDCQEIMKYKPKKGDEANKTKLTCIVELATMLKGFAQKNEFDPTQLEKGIIEKFQEISKTAKKDDQDKHGKVKSVLSRGKFRAAVEKTIEDNRKAADKSSKPKPH